MASKTENTPTKAPETREVKPGVTETRKGDLVIVNYVGKQKK